MITVTAVRGDTTIALKIGSSVLSRNSVQITLDIPAQITGGRTLIPARAVAECLGADVDWIESTETVVIKTGSMETATYYVFTWLLLPFVLIIVRLKKLTGLRTVFQQITFVLVKHKPQQIIHCQKIVR